MKVTRAYQFDLPLVPGPARASRRPRISAERVYAAVVWLRAAGHRVNRVSADQHRVDGRLVSTRELVLLLGPKACPDA